MGFKENSSHGLHKRWVERKLELEVGKVQAKLLSKGIAIPEPKPDDVEASNKVVVAHLPKLHIDMYGRNPNGTHKPSPERLQRGSGATKTSQSVVERLDRMMNPGVMSGLPDELAAAYGLPRSPRREAPDLSPNGAAYGWRRPSGAAAAAAAGGSAAGAGVQPPSSPSHPRGGVQTSLGSPRLASPRSGSPGATGSLGAHGHSYSNPISAAAASAALAKHGKAAAGRGAGGAGPQSGAPSPSGAAGGGGAAAIGAEAGLESPGPASPAPVQLRPDLEGAEARIEGAMSEVERVTLPANEMGIRERVIHLARQVNPNFELQPPRNRARLAGGEYGGGRSRRDLGLWRRSSKHLGSGAVGGAASFRAQEGASGGVSSRNQGGAASRREQSLPPLGGQGSERTRSIGKSRSSGIGGPSAPQSDRSMAGVGGAGGAAGPSGEPLPPLSPASASRQAVGQAHTAGDGLPGVSSSTSLPMLGGRSSGGGTAGDEPDLLGRNFPEDTANTLIELWEEALEVQAAEAAARAEAEEEEEEEEEEEPDEPEGEDQGGLDGEAGTGPDGSSPGEAAGDAGPHAPG
ncbi:hypothetical protein HYH02_009070 [Chlamydomonas schloesseri]|uniref:Uncharacterized protein n=1 Tax=Chlamydomonas schloesseri TaxID=2026947 RepID=A0A835WB34_9CHLO|nr:hypothetical protein HYH02_009070 [Chlamydomonas schloesseri]|eukprot:KAG2444130.1 hypothetical protein HYH02_009070 [Chlamydomonas schloesseri]